MLCLTPLLRGGTTTLAGLKIVAFGLQQMPMQMPMKTG
jgi:hypothetical protein